VLTALVVGHGRHPFALLSADVISELSSTEQNEENRD
jgi:multisubunit Na+/H+ antiporter MnhC subunit|tara:strand:- start:687 stop:797 length:111 start_codon:yes stop_codon:yes gene_type:complete